MKKTHDQNQYLVSLERLNGIFRLALIASVMMAAIACSTQPKSVASTAKAGSAAATAPAENRLTYDQYLAQGKSELAGGKPGKAIIVFKLALRETNGDEAKQRDAYGNLGVAYEAAADYPRAQAYLEKAGAKEQAPAWIKDAYKHLLSSQKFMTADYMEKKLQAEQEIEQEQAQMLAADESASEEAEGTGSGTKRRGFSVGKPAAPTLAMVDKDAYKPKPAEPKASSKSSPKPSAKTAKRSTRPGPTPVASSSHREEAPISSETTLDIRINFGFRSAALTPDGEKQADELGKLLQQKLQDGNLMAVIVGHTDIFGGEEYNDHLSEDRAAAVMAYLVTKFPDLKGKLSERGMGKRQPLYLEEDDQSQSLNRRVEVKLKSL